MDEDDPNQGANNPPPPPATPLPSNFNFQVAFKSQLLFIHLLTFTYFLLLQIATDDDESSYKNPPEAPPRHRRNRKSLLSSGQRASSALNLSSTGSPQVSFSNGLPPTPKVHMGACFSKVFNECPLKIHCAASWVHPDTHDQHILLGK